MVYERIVTVGYENGLHVRPCSALMHEYQVYVKTTGITPDIGLLRKDDNRQASLKSTIDLLTLGADKGTEISVFGPKDNSDLVDKIADMIEQGG